MARRPASRPWLPLGFLSAVLVVCYACIVGFGMSPRLGLDLSGGTSLTLKPASLEKGGKPPTKEQLDKAVDIIRLRVDQFGVGESSVARQGPYIVVEVPGSDREGVVNKVGSTALLYFREVACLAACQDTSAATASTATTVDPSATPSVAPSASPSAAPEASTTVTPSPAAATTNHPRPLPAATSAPLASPSVTVSPTPKTSASPSRSVSPSPTSSASPSASPSETPPPVPKDKAGVPLACAVLPVGQPLPADKGLAHAQGCFAVLDCSSEAERSAGSQEQGDAWTVGCGGTGVYHDASYLLKPAAVKGTDVKSAAANLRQTGSSTAQFSTGEWEVDINFKNDKFEKLTETTAYGSSSASEPTCAAAQPTTCQVAISLDGIVESAPINESSIRGSASITGNFKQSDAKDLANVLKFGALPISFDNASAESISPTLGKSSLHAGLLAGGLGLILVIIYCFIYYRALGIVTIASLGVSGAMVYAAITLLGKSAGLTLSLAGIAGFIVAVGITADSFVVYFERIKDEVRDGRSPRSAVEVGWRSAKRTIISADLVSILAAVLLYIFSIGSVRGFAFTLGVSTVLDLVTVFLFTKPLMTLLVNKKLFSTSKYSGLQVSGPQAPLRRRPGPGGRLNPATGVEGGEL